MALFILVYLYILPLQFHYISLSNYLFFQINLFYVLSLVYCASLDNLLLVHYYLLLPYYPVDLFLFYFGLYYSIFCYCFFQMFLPDFLPLRSWSDSFLLLQILFSSTTAPFLCSSIPNFTFIFFLSTTKSKTLVLS